MTQRSFHWDGASLGDADALTVNAADGIGYRLANEDYESPYVDRGLRMLFNGDENRGVLRSWLNELEVTGAASPIQVDTGGAMVYGMPYENTAAVNVVIPSPTTDTRQDRIVLRRDWAAQTVRITRIAGTEGGGVPEMTQSPSPTGSGFYDVPLASISITTGGVITVTDTREFCTFGGVPGAGSLGTTQLSNDSIDFADRETRTYRAFLGGGCIEPALNASQFQYSDTPSYITMTGAPTWNGGANIEGWQLTGSAYEGGYVDWVIPPPNYASGDISTYIWWSANAGLAATFYMRSVFLGGNEVGFAGQLRGGGSGGYSSVYINETIVANQLRRTAGVSIPAAYCSPSLFYYYGTHKAIHYMAYWYNSAGAENINLLGIEFVYTGYV